MPRDEKKDADVTPTYCTDIQRIEAYFVKIEKEKKRATPVDTYMVMDTKALLAKAYLPTLAPRLSGTSNVIPSVTPSTCATFLPPRFGTVSTVPGPCSLRLQYYEWGTLTVLLINVMSA